MAMTEAPSRRRLLTIGTVCNRLQDEFPDVSISKIRYLEDQGLLNPRRTQGGYRLFSEDDVERLETILRLQRDEFLPLRVIREELEAGAGKQRRRRRSVVDAGEEELDLEELCERAGITAERARELEEFGLLESRVEDGQRIYAESDADIAAACEALARFGIDPRNLRAFRTAADRESSLLEAVIGPALRSRSAERRQAALGDLQQARAERPGAGRPAVAAQRAAPGGVASREWRGSISRRASARSRTFRSRASASRTSRRCSSTPRRCGRRSASSPTGRASAGRTSCSAPRPAASGSGAAIAVEAGCGFVAARRPGKLPPETVSATYALEYGQNTLEVAADAIGGGARVVIHDDVLATGGTVEAIAGLVEQLGRHGRRASTS